MCLISRLGMRGISCKHFSLQRAPHAGVFEAAALFFDCQGLVFVTGLQRLCSFPDTSGTRKIQKTASANDCFNVLDKCGFPVSCKLSEQSCVSQRLIKKTPIRRNTQKRHLQTSDQNLTTKSQRKR